MSAASRTIAKDEIAVLLSPALGQEKSDEVVVSAARRLGLAGKTFTADEARAIFDRLAEEEGFVGVVARLAISRGDVDTLVAKAPSSRRVRVDTPPRSRRVDLVPLLAPALGAAKARETIEAAAQKLGLDPDALDRDAALAVFDELSANEGIVGVVARFAKARFVLEPSR
jgi:hypothetical protein